MIRNKVKQLQTCEVYDSIISTELGGRKDYSCPYEFLWVVEHIEKEPSGLSKQDIELLSDIGIPLTNLKGGREVAYD